MVNVIGLGYIGLPTALMMATHGVEVVGTDYNKELVATLPSRRRAWTSCLPMRWSRALSSRPSTRCATPTS